MVASGILVKNTDQYSYNKTSGGLLIAGSGDEDVTEKKYRLGEVLAVGDGVPSRVHVGDIVVYLQASAYRMPNGQNSPDTWKITYNDMSLMAVLPNLDPVKRHPDWAVHPHIADLEPEVAQWQTGQEAAPKPVEIRAGAVASPKKAARKAPAKKAVIGSRTGK